MICSRPRRKKCRHTWIVLSHGRSPFRSKRTAKRIAIPGFRRCLVEFAIAIPILIVTMVAMAGLNYFVGILSPGKTLTADAVTAMASSPPRYIYPLLLFSFTFAPIAEECFFRGFVHNAFRQRMPTIVAGLLQSLTLKRRGDAKQRP